MIASPTRREHLGLGLVVCLTAVWGPACWPAAAQEVLQAVDLGGLETRSAALILSGQEAGDLNLAMLAVPLAGTTEAASSVPVALVVDIGGASLLETLSDDEAYIEIYAYVLGPGNELIATTTEAFKLEVPAFRALDRSGLKYLGRLELPPGDHSLRVLVLHRKSGRLGLRIAPLHIAATPAEALPTPVLTEPATRWVLVKGAGAATPFPVGRDAAVPATRPVIGGEGMRLLLPAATPPPGLVAKFLGEDREEIAEIGLGDLRPALGGPELLAAELIPPASAEDGEYFLRLEAGGRQIESPRLVMLRGRERLPSWPDLVDIRASETAELQPRAEESAALAVERRPELDAARDAYRQALEALKAGDRSSARLAIIELERSLLGEIDAKTPEVANRLAAAQLTAGVELAAGDPGGLVPFIWLHEQLFRQYYQHRHYHLASHARRTMLVLAEKYLDLDESDAAREVVSTALTSLGGYLQDLGRLPAAEDAYILALDYAGKHRAALAGLATIRESYGDYEKTAELLNRLIQLQPEDPRVGLRLAVNLRRMGSTRRATKLLRACIDGNHGGWASAVAYQELAALYLEEEQFDEADRTLEQALARHPDVQRLYLQRAALLDRMGRPAEARELLARMDPGTGREGDSPRMLYARMPSSTLRESRRALAEQALAHLPPAGDVAGGR